MIISVADAILQGRSLAADIVHLEEPVYSPITKITKFNLYVAMLAHFLQITLVYEKCWWNRLKHLPSIRKKIGGHNI